MGTSMTLSEREKSKLLFRNHAIHRNKIPPDMEKYYRYKAEYVKNRGGPKKGKQGQEHESCNWEMEMPNDIPSIQEHSDLISGGDHISEDQNECSDVQQWDNRSQTFKQKQNKTQNAFASHPKQQKSHFHPSSTHPIPDKSAQYDGVSQLPNNSQNSKSSPRNSNNRSSNKKSSNFPQSESNHALSQIIFQREAQASTNTDKFFADQIKQDCKYHKTDNYKNYRLKYVEEGQNEDEEQTSKNEEFRPTKESAFRLEKGKRMEENGNVKINYLDEQLLKKINPHNMVLELNSNINSGCENSIKPIPVTNIEYLSRITNLYSNTNSNSLTSNGKPRKLIYF